MTITILAIKNSRLSIVERGFSYYRNIAQILL